jgi:hypothetical protein
MIPSAIPSAETLPRKSGLAAHLLAGRLNLDSEPWIEAPG